MDSPVCKTSRFQPKEERGTTLAEVVVALAIAAAIAIPMMRMLTSSARNDADQARHIATQGEVWRAADRITRNINGGTFAPSLLRTGSLDQNLPLVVINRTGTEELITWQVTNSGLQQTATKPVIEARGKPTTLAPEVVPNPKQPTFVYLTTSGKIIPADTDPAKLAYCTARVKIYLHTPSVQGGLDVNQSSATFRLNTTAQEC